MNSLMLPAKSFYFFYFAAFAALIPFLILYYEQLGFTGQQIGILSAISPAMMLVSAPLWGMIADVTKRYMVVLLSLIALATIFGLILIVGTTFPILVILFSAFAFFVSPIVALGDTVVMSALGENKSDYGRLRVWGAVGWGLSAPIAGIFTERYDITWAFYIYALLMIFCLVSSSRLSFSGLQYKEKQRRDGGGSSLLEFLRPNWLFFFSAVFVAGIGLSISGSFVYLRLSELLATGLIVGLALTMATLSELPLTFYGKQLLNRFSTWQLVFAALIIVGLRLILYGFSTSPIQILLIQLSHGFCFSILWIAGIAYVDDQAPDGKSATAQGLFGAILFGLGSAAGGLFGGYYYDSLGAELMFKVFGVGILIASFLLIMIQSFKNNRL